VKIKRNAVTGRKLRNNSLTGSDVKESSLRTVPSANSADTANTAASATTANTATNVAASEGFHQVGAGGEPGFQNGCTNATSGVAAQEYESVGFYKDKLGVVHLMGLLQCPTTGSAAFQLPAGYRPADNRVLVESRLLCRLRPRQHHRSPEHPRRRDRHRWRSTARGDALRPRRGYVPGGRVRTAP
jgi:hypothetical protein